MPGVRCRPINTALWVPRASRKRRLEMREGSVPPKLKLTEIHMWEPCRSTHVMQYI